MTNMKIEPGCRAVIVNSRAGNKGIIVTVIKNLGGMGIHEWQGNRWEVDIPMKTTGGRTVNHIGEKQLKRIDNDSRQVTSWESLKDIFIPDGLKELTQ